MAKNENFRFSFFRFSFGNPERLRTQRADAEGSIHSESQTKGSFWFRARCVDRGAGRAGRRAFGLRSLALGRETSTSEAGFARFFPLFPSKADWTREISFPPENFRFGRNGGKIFFSQKDSSRRRQSSATEFSVRRGPKLE